MICKVILVVDGPAYFHELTPQWISLPSGAAQPVSALDYKAGKPANRCSSEKSGTVDFSSVGMAA
jgi:hypothetical protein